MATKETNYSCPIYCRSWICCNVVRYTWNILAQIFIMWPKSVSPFLWRPCKYEDRQYAGNRPFKKWNIERKFKAYWYEISACPRWSEKENCGSESLSRLSYREHGCQLAYQTTTSNRVRKCLKLKWAFFLWLEAKNTRTTASVTRNPFTKFRYFRNNNRPLNLNFMSYNLVFSTRVYDP